MSLPQPTGRQKEVLYLPAEGHIAVLGTAGSGKTTLAILRAAYLANPNTEHYGKTLLVTFNRSLVSYLKHLQDKELANVVVENYHTFARGYLASKNKMPINAICSQPEERDNFIKKAVDIYSHSTDKYPIFSRPINFFSEELRWMSQHGIASFESYRDIDRIGRSTTRVERKDRQIVFEIYEAYREIRQQKGYSYDWDDIATAVCLELDRDYSYRLYKHIIIDEGQDFSPEMIRSLAKAIPSDGSLTFFGDVAQQIYGHRMSWRSAGLNIQKHWEFKENYRNSKGIAKLGLAISKMPYFKGIPDIVEPISPTAEGPLPTLVQCSNMIQEILFVVTQAKQLSKNQTVAILFRDRQDEKVIGNLLPKNSIRLHRDMNNWITGNGIKYGTFHAAKGLEFDAVILPFCNNKKLPDPEVVKSLGEEDGMARDGRLLYVGVTRAKTRLIITYTGEITSLLPSDSNLYERILSL